MRDIVGFQVWFFPLPKAGRVGKTFIYIKLFFLTLRQLLTARPLNVWVQLPQIPALWAAIVYRTLAKNSVKIVADCHNAQLRRPWSNFPFALKSLRSADVILVHNESMLARATEIGWPMRKVLVLEDVPAPANDQPPKGIAAKQISANKPWIVFPGSFAADEPIQEVLEAARIAAECTFVITGRTDRAQQNGHRLDNLPKNVVLAGYLPLELFDDLLREANVVLGLTLVEGIQLSVCNEALSFGRPLVTSNTQILNCLFGEAAVLVETRSPESIAAGCRLALARSAEYSRRSRTLAAARVAEWETVQLRQVTHLLHGGNVALSNPAP